jgi:hypothetical protein
MSVVPAGANGTITRIGRIGCACALAFRESASGDAATLEALCREVAATISRITFIDMLHWDDAPTPEQEWAVYNRIPLRQVTLFSGEGGTGKSITQLHLSVAQVLARDWLGVIPEQGPAIFIDAEDDEKGPAQTTEGTASSRCRRSGKKSPA